MSPVIRSKSPTSNNSPKFEIRSTRKFDEMVAYNQEKLAEKEM